MEEWREQICDLLNVIYHDGADSFSAWEISFIESFEEKVENADFEPTEKQLTKIIEIWERHHE